MPKRTDIKKVLVIGKNANDSICGSPHDTAYLFDEFIGMIKEHKGE